jgi:hypothetical protein
MLEANVKAWTAWFVNAGCKLSIDVCKPLTSWHAKHPTERSLFEWTHFSGAGCWLSRNAAGSQLPRSLLLTRATKVLS